jgi:hypothetical protein
MIRLASVPSELVDIHEPALLPGLNPLVYVTNGTDPHPASPGFAARRRILADLAARFDVSMDAVALAAALARPWADVVLSGAEIADLDADGVPEVHVYTHSAGSGT